MRWETVVALLDTGATTKAVTGELAEKLGLPLAGERNVASAHGDQLVERYLFRVGLFATTAADEPTLPVPHTFDEIEGFRIRTGFRFEALLGMDVLAQCDLHVDRRRHVRLTFGYT